MTVADAGDDVLLDPSWVIGPTPSWADPVTRDVLGTIGDRRSAFPCTFAVAGLKQGTLRFAFVDAPDARHRAHTLLDALREYLSGYRELGRNTSLITLFRPAARAHGIEDYRTQFWAVLQELHHLDPQPWPRDVPADPEDALWEFGVLGVPIFVVCNTPMHRRRASRHAPTLMITFQPRWVFGEIGPETTAGQAARRTIRARLEAFDDVGPSPHLGDYGDPDNREYRQYFLDDGDGPAAGGCPFRVAGL